MTIIEVVRSVFKYKLKNLILIVGIIVAVFVGIITIVYAIHEKPVKQYINYKKSEDKNPDNQKNISTAILETLSNKGKIIVQKIKKSNE